MINAAKKELSNGYNKIMTFYKKDGNFDDFSEKSEIMTAYNFMLLSEMIE